MKFVGQIRSSIFPFWKCIILNEAQFFERAFEYQIVTCIHKIVRLTVFLLLMLFIPVRGMFLTFDDPCIDRLFYSQVS